jgi:hypothetical protein
VLDYKSLTTKTRGEKIYKITQNHDFTPFYQMTEEIVIFFSFSGEKYQGEENYAVKNGHLKPLYQGPQIQPVVYKKSLHGHGVNHWH